MILLLLKPNAATFMGWSVVGSPTSNWQLNNGDYKSTWGAWSTITWGTIQSSALTWGYLSGYTFISTAASPNTTWTVV